MRGARLPSVSVVVAAYAAEETIDDCVRSLLRLRYPKDRLELVVVDNGSPDRTRELLRGYGTRLRLLDEARRGPAAARNTGIRASRGEVIALTDADCTVDPDWLVELVAPLSDLSVGIAGGAILARPPATPIERYGEVIHDHRRAIEFFRPPYAITMNWAARRGVIDELGPFDEELLRVSDSDYSYRAVASGYALAYSPRAIVYHRNESTLAGLFREGWTHGFHGVRVHRRHAAVIAAAAGRPRSEVEQRPVHRGYELVFRSGKRLGRHAGRLALALRG